MRSKPPHQRAAPNFASFRRSAGRKRCAAFNLSAGQSCQCLERFPQTHNNPQVLYLPADRIGCAAIAAPRKSPTEFLNLKIEEVIYAFAEVDFVVTAAIV